MKVIRFVVGGLETNCYFIIDNGKVVIIDPGSGFRRLKQYIEDNDLLVAAILLTHGHPDHIGAVDSLIKQYHCPCYISEYDEKIIHNKEINFGFEIKSNVSYYEKNILDIENFHFEVYETAGHTEGSVCLKIGNHLFTGDTLFKGSVGRTDFYSGSKAQLINSVQIFYHFPLDTIVHPGHEQESSIGEELKNNLYLI